jgi:hypothetical protein
MKDYKVAKVAGEIQSLLYHMSKTDPAQSIARQSLSIAYESLTGKPLLLKPPSQKYTPLTAAEMLGIN